MIEVNPTAGAHRLQGTSERASGRTNLRARRPVPHGTALRLASGTNPRLIFLPRSYPTVLFAQCADWPAEGEMTQVSVGADLERYAERVRSHKSWAARIGWIFRFLFSTVENEPKQRSYDQVDNAVPWRGAFARGPLGSTLGFKNLSPSRNHSKTARINSHPRSCNHP